MPFGLKMSQDVFQKSMDQITDRLPGVIAIHDDICIYGKTQEKHDKHLLQLLKQLQKWISVQQQKISHQQTTDCLLSNNLFSTRNETRSHKDTDFTRPSNTIESKTTIIITGISQLSTTIPSRHCCQDHLSQGTSFTMGLDTFNR